MKIPTPASDGRVPLKEVKKGRSVREGERRNVSLGKNRGFGLFSYLRGGRFQPSNWEQPGDSQSLWPWGELLMNARVGGVCCLGTMRAQTRERSRPARSTIKGEVLGGKKKEKKKSVALWGEK